VKRKLLWGVVALGAVGLLALVFTPKALQVETAEVTRGPFRLTVDEDGKTRVRERYTVSAPVAGTLARIELHAGDAVEPSTVVARLKPLSFPLFLLREQLLQGRKTGAEVGVLGGQFG